MIPNPFHVPTKGEITSENKKNKELKSAKKANQTFQRLKSQRKKGKR